MLDEPAPTPLLAPGADVAVGALVRPRRGDDAVDTYVEPLLGGVYAGRADALSLRMAMPALATAAESAHTLTEALAAAVAARAGGGPPGSAASGSPGFATVVGGVSRLVDAVAGRAARRPARGGRCVSCIRPRPAGGWSSAPPGRRP